MKKLLTLLLIPLAVFAAAPVVTITDSFDAIVDGKNWGKFGDVVVNNKTNAELLVAVNLAVMAKAAAIKTDADAKVAASVKAKADAETAKAVESTRVEAIVAALKGVDPKSLPAPVQSALMTKAQAEKAALLAKKAEIEAALAKATP